MTPAVRSDPVSRPGVPSGRFLVAGLGRAGSSAARMLSETFGAERVLACDAGRPPVDDLGVAVTLATDGCELLEAGGEPVGCLVRSPGIPITAPLVARARQLGVPVIDELELAWRLIERPFAGVTGTNGKSTVCMLLAAAAHASGLDVAIAGNTDFGPPVSGLLASPPELAIAEVSSFQLEACTDLLPELAVLTNLRPEHLGRHGDMRTYAACKRGLFVRGDRCVPRAVVGADDPLGRELARAVSERGGDVLTFGRGPEADFRLLACDWTLERARIDVLTPDGELELHTRLPGLHNADNVLAALAATRALDIGLEPALEAIETARGVPGRLELIDEGQPFRVVVDFAHTADALDYVLRAIRRVTAGRVHAVFGDAGNRTPWLREALGRTAGRLADRLIVTEASLRGESLRSMVEPVIAGARAAGRAKVSLVPERRAAIHEALAGAGCDDVVAVLGRGASDRLHPTLQGEGPPFDDRAVTREELHAIGSWS